MTQQQLDSSKPCNLQTWLIGLIVLGGKDPVSGCVVKERAFNNAFLKEKNLQAWEKIGAVPLQKCLQSKQVRCKFGDAEDEVNAVAKSMQEANQVRCYLLMQNGYNGNILCVTLNKQKTERVTVLHCNKQIELLANAANHGQLFCATGSFHLTSNDFFMTA